MNFLFLSVSLLLLQASLVSPAARQAGANLSLNETVKAINFPIPQGIPNLLFYLQRDPDANTVIYQLNLTERGELNEAEPIRVFWIRYAEKGQRKELTFIHRKFAYGLHVKKLSPERYAFQFVSHDKIHFELRKGKDGRFHVFTEVNQQPLLLKRMFVRIEGGTFWVPNVLYVAFEGRDEATGREIVQRYKP